MWSVACQMCFLALPCPAWRPLHLPTCLNRVTPNPNPAVASFIQCVLLALATTGRTPCCCWCCSFYVQPMLLPLLSEMPAGKVGVDLTCTAVQWVTMRESWVTNGCLMSTSQLRLSLPSLCFCAFLSRA